MKKLLLLSLALAGCATNNDLLNGIPIFSSIDPDLQPYFNQFTAYTSVATTGITAGFISLPGNLAGECIWGGTYNEVRINPDYWFDISVNQKQQLVSHELGHCALFLGHINNCQDGTTAPDGTHSSCNNDQGMPNNMPLSIMNWQAFAPDQADILTIDEVTYYKYLKLNQPVH